MVSKTCSAVLEAAAAIFIHVFPRLVLQVLVHHWLKVQFFWNSEAHKNIGAEKLGKFLYFFVTLVRSSWKI